MDFAGALFAVGHKRVEFRALGLRKVYFPATRWHTPSWWSESTKILQLSKDLLEKLLRLALRNFFGAGANFKGKYNATLKMANIKARGVALIKFCDHDFNGQTCQG